jgi:putative NADPH-quinone reductase
VQVRDLYALYPDYFIDVAAEQAALAQMRLVVWLHPVHWYSMPPLLKLWLDEVFAFRLGLRARRPTLAGKDLWLVASTGGPEASYRPDGYNRYFFDAFLHPYEQTARWCTCAGCRRWCCTARTMPWTIQALDAHAGRTPGELAAQAGPRSPNWTRAGLRRAGRCAAAGLSTMEHGTPWLTSSLVYLGAAVLAVPLARLLGLGSIIGYLGAGIAIGPWGLKLVTDAQDMLHFAEFGVVLMLFLVGLELEPRRLWALRRPIFGWGSVQLLGSAALITALGIAAGVDWRLALVAGLGLGMSSTAIGLGVLATNAT